MLRPILLCLTLGGCTLVDQTTFNPRAGFMEVAPPPPGLGPAPALVTIDFGKPAPVYEAALRQAVGDAVARKPGVAFDVATIVPADGTPAQQVAAATALNPDARTVARGINDAGVDEDRISLSARSEVGVSSRQIRVYVH